MGERPHQLKEIYWRSRRGMLELELKLIPFVRDCFEELSSEEQVTYREILQEEDWQIFDWLHGRSIPQKPQITRLIERIIAHRGHL